LSTQSPPHWNLTSIFPGLDSSELAQAIARTREQLEELDAYLAARQIAQDGPVPGEAGALAGVISGYLERMNGFLQLAWTLRNYGEGFVTTDSFNTAARRLASELDPLFVRAERIEVFFRGWIGTVARQPDLFRAALAQTGAAQKHAFYLTEAAEQSRYLMSPAEETLAAELAVSGASAWQRLQGVVTSQLKVRLEREGQVEELPVTVVQNMRTDPDEGVRRRAHEAEMAAWESVREPLAACLNGVKGAVGTLNRHRGRSDALHSALDQARIDRQTLETMLAAMSDSFPSFRRYWRAKAALLGKSALAWWDLSAPAGRSERRYAYDEARELILGQFGAFSGRLQALARRAFAEGWIDAEPRTGKRGGAFCMRIPAVEESRILCNFDGSLDQVFTLAHELGHAYHNECQSGKAYLQRRTPMTLAETASIFCETILTDAALAQAQTAKEEQSILETFLIGASQVLVDIYSRYLFEQEVFERRAQTELSADEMCEIMLRAQRATYGDGLDGAHLNPYMWAWKPHYYRPGLSFYNFPYAFGLLFGLGLYSVYRQRGRVFLPEYDSLLRSTGEASAADLAARFGIDIRRRDFWEGSLEVIRRRIHRYVELVTRA
jgi:pepF/M3 family oligoendopeptidase